MNRTEKTHNPEDIGKAAYVRPDVLMYEITIKDSLLTGVDSGANGGDYGRPQIITRRSSSAINNWSSENADADDEIY